MCIFATRNWYCGREARLSSAKAATAVRIRSIPLKPFFFEGLFYCLYFKNKGIKKAA